jgi:hypothetical protein
MSETQLRQLLHDAADLSPVTLDRPVPQPVRRHRWAAAVAVTAAAASVAAVALLATAGDEEPRPPQPAVTPSAAPSPSPSPSPSARPSPQPFFGDDQLRIVPMPNAKPALSREQAQLIMVNASPTPPLRPMTGLASSEWRVTLTLARVSLVGSMTFETPVPRELPLAWIASWSRGLDACRQGDVIANVLAADGSIGYQYVQRVECAGQAASPAYVMRMGYTESVPWTATRGPGPKTSTLHFRIPRCAIPTIMGSPDLYAVAKTPVGVTCTGTKAVTLPYGILPTRHGGLGPFRQTMNNGFAPLLEAWPSYPPSTP